MVSVSSNILGTVTHWTQVLSHDTQILNMELIGLEILHIVYKKNPDWTFLVQLGTEGGNSTVSLLTVY